MKLKHILLFLASISLIGCASHTVSTDVSIPKAPPVVEKVSPVISKISDSNRTLEIKIKEQSKTISDQNHDIADALKRAEDIKKQLEDQKQVKVEDANDLVANLKIVHTRNLFLETQNSSLEQTNKDQAVIIENGIKVAAEKDAEVSTLRQQSDQKDQIINKQKEDIKKLTQERDKAEKQAASAKVYRNWIWGLVGGFILWTIIKNILMVYLPSTKFRI